MDYEIKDIGQTLRNNTYPGRGIVVGKTKTGKAAVAYFIMGRSNNSRNRVLTYRDGILRTEPFLPSKVENPSLIIYTAMKKCGNKLIVTNGDHTDTIYEGLQNGKTFSEALSSRTFEPDAPNFTPRIGALLTFFDGDFSSEIGILKSIDGKGTECERDFFRDSFLSGTGALIHTYLCDGNPLPSFCGAPKRIRIDSDIDIFSEKLWEALNAENKISLFVNYIDIASGTEEYRLFNRNR